jgi:hypothetical protein
MGVKGQMLRRETYVLLAILCVLLFGGIHTFFFYAIYPKWHELELLTHKGVQTRGRVTAKEPFNHQGIRYEYRVGPGRYTGMSSAGFGGLPPFDQISVGDEIAVTYLPESPSVSVAGNPKDLYASWSGLLFIIMPLFAAIGVVIMVVRAGRWRKRRQESSPTESECVAETPAHGPGG